MNWDAIAAIAELLAAVGVIVSFLYLARQIQQNTYVQRRSNIEDIAQGLATSVLSISSDAGMSALAVRAFSDLDSLDPVERYRFDCFFYTWLAAFERALLDMRDGEYSTEYMAPMRTAVAGFLRTDGGRAWWKQRSAWFTEYGKQAIDAIVADEQIEDQGVGPPAA